RRAPAAQLPGRRARRLRDLPPSGAGPGGGGDGRMTVESQSRLSALEYAELVARVQQTVAENVPPGASLLVVSKGDAGLLEMPGLKVAHFPQDGAGGYAGHHPRD